MRLAVPIRLALLSQRSGDFETGCGDLQLPYKKMPLKTTSPFRTNIPKMLSATYLQLKILVGKTPF
jgi:hypothetical protein